jgi:phosphoribosylanthranilate isomerase
LKSSRKSSLKLKVCGLTQKSNLESVVASGVDFAGLIFYQKSPRYMADKLLSADLDAYREHVSFVGVFVNETLEVLIELSRQFQLNIIQLHGIESPEYCQNVQEQGFQVMKVFGVGESFDFSSLKPYLPVVDYFLFDTKSPQYGGTGVSFQWSVLKDYPYDKPFWVGGGVSVENLPSLLSLHLPHLYAVDMNSALEISPGLKDISKVKASVKIMADYNSIA